MSAIIQSVDYNCGNKELLNIHKKAKHSKNFGHNRQNKTNYKSVIKRQITAVNNKANDYPKDRETNEFVCHHSNCGKRFAEKIYLNDHLKRHKMVKPISKKHICHYPGCEKAFPVPFKLQRHIRTHTGEKPFECDTCYKKFVAKDKLNDHINRCHKLLDEPMVCGIDDCVKQFRTELSLKTHQQTYHLLSDKFVCDYPKCDYKTNFKQSLSHHKIRIHTNERPFKCQFKGCDKAFKIESDLKLHLEGHSTTLHDLSSRRL